MDHVQTVGALNWRALSFVFFMALLPIVFIAVAMKLIGSPKATSTAMVIAVLVLPIFLLLLAQLFMVNVKVSGHALTVGGGLYSLTLPMGRLHLADVKIVSRTDPALAMRLRTNGIGMPGLRLGWFTQRSGHRAFLAVSDRDRVVVIPTALGYDVLISPQDPDALLEALRAQ